MKKVMVSLVVVVLFVFLAGCIDYKAYEIKDKGIEENGGDKELINEIANVEKQIQDEKKTTEVKSEELSPEVKPKEEIKPVEKEVVLPELTKDAKKSSGEEQVITIKENEYVRLAVKINDPDQDRVTYTFSKPLNQRGEWKTNYGDAGEYLITITASDGKLTTNKKVKIVVGRVNVAPIIEGVKDLTVMEGATIKLEPKVTDPNKDPVTVKISNPLKNGVWVTDHTSAGVYKITVTASDGELETTKEMKLVVNNVNVLPVIDNIREVITIKEGETLKLEPKVSDLDDDPITVTISDPVGNDGIWEIGYTNHGSYLINVVADDGKDKVTKRIKLTVEDVNMPPEIVDVSLNTEPILAPAASATAIINPVTPIENPVTIVSS